MLSGCGWSTNASGGAFDRVVFAILERGKGRGFTEAFEARFAAWR